MSSIIPLFKPVCGQEEIDAVTRVLKSCWWGMGPETEAFEAEFATYTGSGYAVAVNSGTMALELAARATGLTGGLVVVPALTFISTAQAMRHAGNQVVFADIDEDTLCLNWGSVKDRLELNKQHSGPRGVVPVWYGGHVMQLPHAVTSGAYADVKVIEDCAHAAGSWLSGRLGIASAWSFHAVKNLATGDGGMITTDDEEVAKKARRLRWCGIDRSTYERDTKKGYGWDYDIQGDGEKAHMNDITAALGRVQLKYLEHHNTLRRSIARGYNEALDGLTWLKTPEIRSDSSTHLYVVRVPAEDRDRFIQHCISQGVSAGVHYKPLTSYHYLHPFSKEPHWLPVTNRVWKQLVTLPLFPYLTVNQSEQVIRAVRSFPI